MRSTGSSARFDALGGVAVVAVSDPSRLPPARAAVQRTIAAFDHACSPYRADSEISLLNAASGRSVRVGPLLLDAVQAALRGASLTDGDVDPTVGGSLFALGCYPEIDRDDPLTAGAKHRVSVVAVPGWRTVQVDTAGGAIRLARGVRLDLGATAKALAADRAASAASEVTGCGVLVSLSGDIAVSGDAPEHGWRVRVTDDHRSGVDAPGQWITLRTGGLATSSTVVRRWSVNGGEAHHVIDPATGAPAEGIWRTATVAADSCLDANIASTAAIVRGRRALAWLSSMRLPSRLVAADGAACHVAGWPAESEDLSLRGEADS